MKKSDGASEFTLNDKTLGQVDVILDRMSVGITVWALVVRCVFVWSVAAGDSVRSYCWSNWRCIIYILNKPYFTTQSTIFRTILVTYDIEITLLTKSFVILYNILWCYSIMVMVKRFIVFKTVFGIDFVVVSSTSSTFFFSTMRLVWVCYKTEFTYVYIFPLSWVFDSC